MANYTRSCSCGAATNRWRSCPDNACKAEIVYCEKCGGDDRARSEMEAHIGGHR